MSLTTQVVVVVVMQHCEIESTLQPLNETLVHLVYGSGGSSSSGSNDNNNNNNITSTVEKQSQEKDILHIMKLMASIRTRALETGWDTDCDRDMEHIQSTLQRLKKMHL